VSRYRSGFALLIVLALFVLPLWWLGSAKGHAWLEAAVATVSGGTVVVRGLHGHPLSAMDIDEIVYNDAAAGTYVRVKALHLDWSPLALLFARLDISTLEVESLQVQLSASSSKAEPSGFLYIPSILLQRMRINTVNVQQADGSVINVDSIAGDGIQFSEHFAGTLATHIGNPDVQVEFALSGTLQQWLLNGDVVGDELGRLMLSIKGKAMALGDASIRVIRGDQTARIHATWRREKGIIKATGDADVKTRQAQLTAKWYLHADISKANARWNINTEVHSGKLSRPMKITITNVYADAILHTRIEEVDHGLTLECTYANDTVDVALALTNWHSPFKDAQGVLTGALTGNWHTDSRDWQLRGKIDESALAGMAASLNVNADGKGKSWRLTRTDIQILGLVLHASGHGDSKRFLLNGTVNVTDIGQLMKLAGNENAAGKIQADLRVHGSYEDPILAIDGVAEAIRLNNLTIGRININGDLTGHSGTGNLKLLDIKAGGIRQVRQLNLDAAMQDESLNLTLASKGRLQATLSAHLRLVEGNMQNINLNRLRIAYGGTELIEANALNISRDGTNGYRMRREPLRLLGAKSSAEFAWGGEQTSLKLDVHALDLRVAAPWMQNTLYHLQGKSDIAIDLSGSARSPKLDVTITSPILSVTHIMFANEPNQKLNLEGLRLHGDYADHRMHWQMQAKIPNGGMIESHGNYALNFSVDPWRMDAPKQQDGFGKFVISLDHLNNLKPLIPRIDPFNGDGNIELSWRTPIVAKSIQGHGHLHLDALGIPELGLDMKGDARLHLENGLPIMDMAIRGGEGNLRIKGPIDIEKRTIPEIHLYKLPLMNLPDQQLSVSGLIKASEHEHIGMIIGKLDVVHMSLQIPESMPKPTSDLQWEQKKNTPKLKSAALTSLNLDLNIGENARIYGRGMSLKPQGDLHLGGSLSKPRLTGVLKITGGKIEYRSIKLDIQSDSNVVFSGDPSHPTLYIKAARKVGGVTAGLLIEGPADQLTTHLYSTPTMSNAEIFSYIATGRPLASLGKDKAGDMMSVAEFILGPGSIMQEVQNKVKQSTGLDVFEVSGDATSGNVRAGRTFSDKLTVTVDQSISKDSSTALTLEYLLTKSFSVFAKQTAKLAPGVGVRYNKEWFASPKKKPEDSNP